MSHRLPFFAALTCVTAAPLFTSVALAAAATAADDHATVHGAAEDAPILLEPLTVTAGTRTERLLTEVPIRTEVVLSEDIALRAPLNLSQAVELTNGVRIENNCQNCNTSEVQLLGLPGAYNQILFDGTPLLSTLGAVYGLEQIPVGFVDRIELVKGGGSALYGPGAVAGVINLVSLRPQRSGGFVQAGLEWQEGEPIWMADARVNLAPSESAAAHGRHALAVSVVGQAVTHDAIDFNGDGYSEIARRDLLVGGVQAWFTPTARTTLRAHHTYTDEARRGGDRLDRPPHEANIAESLDTRYHRGALAWDQTVTPDFDFTATYAFAHIARDSYYGGLGGDDASTPLTPESAPGAGDNDQPLIDQGYATRGEVAFDQYGHTVNPLHFLDLLFRQRLGDHALAYGAQYKHESVRDEKRDGDGARVGADPLVDDTFTNLGFLLQDEWTATERLDLVLGARLDDASTVDRLVFSPRLAAAYAATPRLRLRAAFSTGFRAPDVFSEDLHVDTIGATPVPVSNAPGLSEESSRTVQLGFAYAAPASAPLPWTWDLTASRTEIADTFVLSRVGATDLRTNGSGSTVTGLETNLGLRLRPDLRLDLGLAYYLSRYDEAETVFDDGAGVVITTRDYLKTPRLTVLAQAVWSPAEEWDVFAALKTTGPMDVVNNNSGTLRRTPVFHVVDLGFTRHFSLPGGRHLDWSLGVKNLFDERQRDLESGAGRDSDYVYGPRFARSFYTQVRHEF